MYQRSIRSLYLAFLVACAACGTTDAPPSRAGSGGLPGVAGGAGVSGVSGAGGVLAGTGGIVAGAGGMLPVAGSGATGGGDPITDGPLIPRTELGEVCYDLPVHGGLTEGDSTKYDVGPGEHYAEWVYRIPWKAGEVASRFGAVFDNLQVLHHWLLYDDRTGAAPGTHRPSMGFTNNAQLIAGWAIGGKNVTMPDDVGLELPAPGTVQIQVQWHFYNSTGVPQPDGTIVQVCTVPAGSRLHTASLTWLGTEALAIGPGTNDFSGTCMNDSGADINIVVLWPHMHRRGRNMRSSINGREVFNQPFSGDYQIAYNQDPIVVLRSGESITSTCTFQNDTGFTTFGPSTDQEMCYQFAFAYPAQALDNGAPGANGASNNCW